MYDLKSSNPSTSRSYRYHYLRIRMQRRTQYQLLSLFHLLQRLLLFSISTHRAKSKPPRVNSYPHYCLPFYSIPSLLIYYYFKHSSDIFSKFLTEAWEDGNSNREDSINLKSRSSRSHHYPHRRHPFISFFLPSYFIILTLIWDILHTPCGCLEAFQSKGCRYREI